MDQEIKKRRKRSRSFIAFLYGVEIGLVASVLIPPPEEIWGVNRREIWAGMLGLIGGVTGVFSVLFWKLLSRFSK